MPTCKKGGISIHLWSPHLPVFIGCAVLLFKSRAFKHSVPKLLPPKSCSLSSTAERAQCFLPVFPLQGFSVLTALFGSSPEWLYFIGKWVFQQSCLNAVLIDSSHSESVCLLSLHSKDSSWAALSLKTAAIAPLSSGIKYYRGEVCGKSKLFP